jgi:hypothetical protein
MWSDGDCERRSFCRDAWTLSHSFALSRCPENGVSGTYSDRWLETAHEKDLLRWNRDSPVELGEVGGLESRSRRLRH